MRYKKFHEVEVSVLSGDFTGLGSNGATPLVRIVLGVRKGSRMETVNTNCQTKTMRERTTRAIWNENFRIPVNRDKDVLMFRVLDQTPLGVSLVGVALIPVKHCEEVSKRESYVLEVFDPSISVHERVPGHEIGMLTVALQIIEEEIQLLEKEDLKMKYSLSLREKTDAIQSRFLGIGELANIMFEEGYSDDVEENWQRAKTMLTEQRAYAIWEETGSTDDLQNYKQAERDVEREHGLWDGL